MRKNLAFLTLPLVSLSLLFTGTLCGDENPFGVKSELVTRADRAAAMVFAPDGRLFYAEQYTGRIRVVTAEGKLLEEPFAQLQVANYLDLDWGLTGLALDPDFKTNHYLYAFLTDPVDPNTPIGRPALVRLTDQDNRGVNPTVIIGNFPQTLPNHQGFNANGRIHFGPDGFLYISLGDFDAQELRLSQDMSSPVGKMLRVRKEDGSPAPGNPFLNKPNIDQRIFALGFREPFDFAFHPRTGQIYSSDNTSAGTCEELNMIQSGANYGWPDVGEFPYSDCQAGQQTKAIHFFARERMQPGDFLSFVAVSGLAFVSGDVYPLLGDSLLACEFETGMLRRLILSMPDLNQVTNNDVIRTDCKRGIAVSPSGIVYYSNDKEIRRLVPQQ